MKIEDYLKEENVRLTNGNKWLVWDIDEWVVREHKYGQRGVTIIYRGNNLNKALKSLS